MGSFIFNLIICSILCLNRLNLFLIRCFLSNFRWLLRKQLWVFFLNSEFFLNGQLFRIKIFFFRFLFKETFPLAFLVVLIDELIELFHSFFDKSVKMVFDSVVTSSNGKGVKKELNDLGPSGAKLFVGVNHDIVLFWSPFFLSGS